MKRGLFVHKKENQNLKNHKLVKKSNDENVQLSTSIESTRIKSCPGNVAKNYKKAAIQKIIDPPIVEPSDSSERHSRTKIDDVNCNNVVDSIVKKISTGDDANIGDVLKSALSTSTGATSALVDREMKVAQYTNNRVLREFHYKIKKFKLNHRTKPSDDIFVEIEEYVNELNRQLMKHHQFQIQSIIANCLSKHGNSMHSDESVVSDDHDTDKQIQQTKIDVDIEYLKEQIVNHSEKLNQLNNVIYENYTQTVGQVCANEQHELNNLLIKEELIKCQSMIEEVCLVNESLRTNIQESELNIFLTSTKKPPNNLTNASIQTDERMKREEGIQTECATQVRIESMDKKAIHDCSPNNILENTKLPHHPLSQCDAIYSESIMKLQDIIYELKIDKKKRKKSQEKLTLQNTSLKCEICELKHEIKKYTRLWACDRYFNSLFLDTQKRI